MPGLRFNASDRQGAFTLIELLTVIAIIGVLSAISFGVVRGVKQRAASARAQTELAVLAQALEAFKRQYGDYPQDAPTAAQLYQALNGQLGPTLATLTSSGRRFISAGQLTLNDADPKQVDSSTNFLIDPWGNAYRYVYFKTTSTPARRGFVLYSTGPDGAEDAVPSVTDGTVDASTAHNVDNLYTQS